MNMEWNYMDKILSIIPTKIRFRYLGDDNVQLIHKDVRNELVS